MQPRDEDCKGTGSKSFEKDYFMYAVLPTYYVHFDELMKACKDGLQALADPHYITFYVHRTIEGYAIVVRFSLEPELRVSAGIQFTKLPDDEKHELAHKQLYTLNEQGYPVLVEISSKYRLSFYFSDRYIGNTTEHSIKTVFNPAEYTAAIDFAFNDAMIVCENKRVLRDEAFFLADEWSRDVRVGLNEEARIAYGEANNNATIKAFQDYKPNDMVLVNHGGYIRRGMVLSCDKPQVHVFLVDYGTSLDVLVQQLRVAPAGIIKYRFFAIPCVLAGLGPVPESARKSIVELLNNVDRTKVALEVLHNTTTAMHTLNISFYEPQSDEPITLAQYLQDTLAFEVQPAESVVSFEYSRMDMFKLLPKAQQLIIEPNEYLGEIRRPFVEPEAFLSKNGLKEALENAA